MVSTIKLLLMPICGRIRFILWRVIVLSLHRRHIYEYYTVISIIQLVVSNSLLQSAIKTTCVCVKGYLWGPGFPIWLSWKLSSWSLWSETSWYYKCLHLESLRPIMEKLASEFWKIVIFWKLRLKISLYVWHMCVDFSYFSWQKKQLICLSFIFLKELNKFSWTKFPWSNKLHPWLLHPLGKPDCHWYWLLTCCIIMSNKMLFQGIITHYS